MVEISVIIPCYNTEQKFLIDCIESVIHQTFEDFEVILVDDGSEESYREIYKYICTMDSRVKVIFKENGGVSSARNLGVQQSLGKYIIFADSDDKLFPAFFQEAYDIISKENADIVFGGNIHLYDYEHIEVSLKNEDNDIVSLNDQEICKFKLSIIGEVMSFHNGLIYIGRGPWSRILRRELALETPFDERLDLYEDVIWNLQILSKSKRICYVKRAWYIYSDLHQESLSRKFNRNSLIKEEIGLDYVRKYVDFNSDMEYKAFCDCCLRNMSRLYKNAQNGEKKILRELETKLYTEWQWNIITEKRFWKLSNAKTKIKIIFFRMRIFFLFLDLKRFIQKISIKI